MKDIEKAISEVKKELDLAIDTYEPFNSYHEGFAVLLEEVNELWDEIKMKPALREKLRLRSEAKQVAAMALRFMVNLT